MILVPKRILSKAAVAATIKHTWDNTTINPQHRKLTHTRSALKSDRLRNGAGEICVAVQHKLLQLVRIFKVSPPRAK